MLAIDRSTMDDIAPKAGLAAVMLVTVVAAGIGYLIYRRRQRLSLAQRLQDALPDVDELRAAVKKPLQRAVRAL